MPSEIYRHHTRARRAIGILLIVYAALVVTHDGEFWPFSIYPMFSQAGQPWHRALVRELPQDFPPDSAWKEVSVSTLPGTPFAVADHGIFQNDFSNYVSKTKSWDATRLKGLHAMFRPAGLDERRLLIFKITGMLEDNGDRVDVRGFPVAMVSSDFIRLNPKLDLSH